MLAKERIQNIYPEAHIQEVKKAHYEIEYQVTTNAGVIGRGDSPKDAWINAGQALKTR